MALLDDLVETPEEEPDRRAASQLVGPAVLRPDQLQAMERALRRELPSFAARLEHEQREATATRFPPPPPPPTAATPSTPPTTPGTSAAAPAPLPIWVPPSFDDGREPLPVWTPPEPVAPARSTSPLEPCPQCGEEVAVTRIDLTANASWLTCRSCGLRWGGTIERRDGATAPLPLPPGDGERGRVAAG